MKWTDDGNKSPEDRRRQPQKVSLVPHQFRMQVEIVVPIGLLEVRSDGTFTPQSDADAAYASENLLSRATEILHETIGRQVRPVSWLVEPVADQGTVKNN